MLITVYCQTVRNFLMFIFVHLGINGLTNPLDNILTYFILESSFAEKVIGALVHGMLRGAVDSPVHFDSHFSYQKLSSPKFH